MSNHLFLFTIGPVQSFIAQARKTQDLYAGSALLSDLIHFALGYTKFQGHDIIFPYYESHNLNFDIEKVEDEPSYPNRFIALLDIENQDKVKVFGQSLENLVKNKLEDLATDKFGKFIPAQSRPSGLCEQIKDFLEIYWTAIPFDKEEAKNENKDNYYANKFKELEQYLGAVKNVRSFRQLPETGRKCSVNGEYNVKVYRKTDEEEKNSLEKVKRSKLFADDNYIINGDYKSIKYRHVQPGEGLCAISFLKRLYKDKDKEEQNFPSTAKIALLNLWNDSEIEALITDLKNLFEKGTFDQELLFDDNLNDDYIKKNGVKFKEGKTLQDAQKQQRKIFDKAKELKLKPSKYYALLSFDGDSMGKWLSKAESSEQHQKFSALLVKFAKRAKDILDGKEVIYGENLKIEAKKRGQTVYAGGDDFLGFVNLEHLFKTIECLKAVFDTEVTKKVKIKNGTKEFTISMGVVIAHYKMPLGIVVKRVKVLEKEAKAFSSEKNNIGFCYMTTNNILAKGCLSNKDWHILERLTNYFKDDKLSSKFAFSFTQSTFLLNNETNWDTSIILVEALNTELARLIKRSASTAFKAEKNGQDFKLIDVLIEDLRSVFVKNRVETENGHKINIDNFTGMLKFSDNLSAKL